jgi:hypothetical protein
VPGNIVLNIPAPVGAGNYGQVVVSEAGTTMFQFGSDLGGVGNAKMWMGPNLTLSTTNYTLKSDGATKTTINSPSEMLLTVPISGSIVQQFGTQILQNAFINGAVNSQNAQTVNTITGYVRTTNNTPTLILDITLPSSSGSLWSIIVVGRDVSSGTVGDVVSITQNSMVKNVSGTASIVSAGSATNLHDTSMSSCAVTYSASSASIGILVTGISATIDWVARLTITTC